MRKFLLLIVCALVSVSLQAQSGSKKSKTKSTTPPPAETPVKAAKPLPKLANAQDSLAYAMGVVIGTNMKNQINSSDLDKTKVLDAVMSVMNGDSMLMTPMQASKLEADYKKSQFRKVNETNIKMCEDFLAKNKKRPEVTTTPSGLQYEILKKAENPGAMPTAASTVKVHYHGTNVDGSIFDSSVDRGQPIEFPLTRVIKGWTEGLQYMHVGDKFKFFIPQDLAYGERPGSPKIKPFSALIFEVELLDITK